MVFLKIETSKSYFSFLLKKQFSCVSCPACMYCFSFPFKESGLAASRVLDALCLIYKQIQTFFLFDISSQKKKKRGQY